VSIGNQIVRQVGMGLEEVLQILKR